MQKLKIDTIRVNNDTQIRESLDQNIILQYAELMLEGAIFPPIVVFYDGTDYILSDGFHRLESSKKVGYEEIDAEIKEGTLRDAVLYSVGANSVHGLNRTDQDKRNAVLTLLADKEWREWSDREIAKRCGVSKSLVSKIRSSRRPSVHDGQIRKATRNGKEYTINTTGIGKKNKQTYKPIEKEVSYGDVHKSSTGQPAVNDENYCPIVEIDLTIQTAEELIVTIKRRLRNLSKKNHKKAVQYLIEKLKEEIRDKVTQETPTGQPAQESEIYKASVIVDEVMKFIGKKIDLENINIEKKVLEKVLIKIKDRYEV